MPHETPEIAEHWNVARLLGWTTDFLKRKGSESPRLDAEVLLAFVLGWERVKLYTGYGEEPDEAGRTRFRDLVKRRSEGAPVAYLVGRKEFFSLSLAVTPDVLIPRPDSEFVVVEFLTAFKGIASPRIVDVGTGSGCIALACAQNHKTATVIAVDLSEAALKVASKNAGSLGLTSRVTFRHGSLLEPVALKGPFDAILSNPPYIKSDVVPTLERGVSEYEPHLALDGGPDGLRVVAPLIEQAVPLLKPGGLLLLEIGSDQEDDVRALLAAQPGLTLAATVRDHAHHPRVLKAIRNA
jgi:release factor glutamine methyltransferase